MNIVTNESIIHAIREFIQCLVDSEYDALLEKQYFGDYGNPAVVQGIQDMIEKHPDKITMPPESVFKTLEKEEVKTGSSDRKVYYVDILLWYSDQKSDRLCTFLCKEKLDDSVHVMLTEIRSLSPSQSKYLSFGALVLKMLRHLK